MKTFKGLPVYIAQIDNSEEGILDISLVDYPATRQDFVLFAQENMKFSIQDESKRIISGVVMQADQPIYRNSPKFGEYYIVFTPETIKEMVLKMFQEGKQNNVSIMHNGDLVEGITLLELFIKDEKKGINPNYLEGVTDGSVIASYKVENETLWNRIKSGEFRGFSLTGLFSAYPEPSDLDSVLDLLTQLEAKYLKK